MINWSDLYYPFIWMISVNAIATVILLLIMTKYPQYAVHAFNRFMCLRLGLSVKKLKLNSHMSISYIERGKQKKDQQTLLLIHGFSSSKFSYFGIIEHLPRRYHIVSLDLPGHGDTGLKEKEEYNVFTMVNYVKQFADQSGLSQNKFHILGTSFGGHVSGLYASLYPNDLHSLSLYCPAGISFPRQFDIIEEAKRTDKFVLLPETDDEFREMIDFITHKKVDIPALFVSGIQQIRNEKKVFFRQFLETLALPENLHSLEESLHKIQTPVLVVWGKEDKVLSVECVDVLKEKLVVDPKHIHILENVGHGIHLERPKKSAFLLLDFLKSLE